MTAKTYAKAATEAPKEHYGNSLPTDRPVAIYYRQSSEGQIGNESTAQQQEDLPQQLIEMGWTAESIIPINDDQAVSGTLDIHERVGMTRLTDLIREGKIGAVALVSENRAFRDQYQDQAAIFARLCAENRVIVIVPNGETYVFHDPRHGNVHHEMFLRAAKDGYNYIKQHIQGKMHTARKRKAQRGLWTGGVIPLGYMVDLATRKFVIYEPIAAVIREYFRLFVFVYLGNLAATARHIRLHGPYLPDLDDLSLQAKLPKNEDGTRKFLLKKPTTMRLCNGHYYPSYAGLYNIFTNVVLIGLWVTSDWETYTNKKGTKSARIVKTTMLKDEQTGKPKVNHPAIIDSDTFQAAFNYLSETTIDGDPNPDYKRPRTTRPKDNDDPRRASVPRPFLERILCAPDTRGDLQPVFVIWTRNVGKYEYVAHSWGETWDETTQLWRKTTDQIDAVVHEMIHAKIVKSHKDRSDIATKLDDHWNENSANFDSERKSCQDMIRLAEKELDRAKMRWENSTEPELVKEAEATYRKVKNNIATYQDKLARIDVLEADQGRQAELRKWVFEMTADYHGLSLEDKRLVLQLIVERVEAHKQGIDLEVKVVFRGGATESRVIGLRHAAWPSHECDRLLKLAEYGASGLQIAGFLPDRAWGSIIAKYLRLTGKRLSARNCLIRKDETFRDFIARHPVDYHTAWLQAQTSRETVLDFLSCTPKEVIKRHNEKESLDIANRFPELYAEFAEKCYPGESFSNYLLRQPEEAVCEDEDYEDMLLTTRDGS